MRGGGGGWSILEFPNAWGGKISMSPVVGVRIFSGTIHSPILYKCIFNS